MSKVYSYHLEMEELFADADYQEWLNNQLLNKEDLDKMEQEYSYDTKMHKFVKMMLEE